MGAELVIVFDCPVKRALGDTEESYDGTLRLMKLKKIRSHALAVANIMRAEGIDPETESFISIVADSNGHAEQSLRVRDLLNQSSELDDLEAHCEGCPAAVLDGMKFGCVGYIQYPISESAQKWLASRIQPADTIGGTLLLSAIADFDYDGSAMKPWRERGILAGTRPAAAVIKKSLFGGTEVTSDQILHAIFAVESPLDPSHCLNLLMFLGAIRIDGTLPHPGSFLSLVEATALERCKRTNLVVGPPSKDEGVAGMQTLLAALYHAWVLDAPLHIDG